MDNTPVYSLGLVLGCHMSLVRCRWQRPLVATQAMAVWQRKALPLHYNGPKYYNIFGGMDYEWTTTR